MVISRLLLNRRWAMIDMDPSPPATTMTVRIYWTGDMSCTKLTVADFYHTALTIHFCTVHHMAVDGLEKWYAARA